ncbi:MAG TPA: NAD-dependent epimerase/dehydratase family protein [Kofleriaceae bacterium]|jgi:nucleoside-diphosphate-sugar epimerase
MQNTETKLALVLGATGGIGGAVAKTLLARGWRVRAMGRDVAAGAKKLPAYEWVQGDAMNAADVLAAARDAEVIVHAVNPPGYRDWEKLVLPMLDNTIAAAKATRARIVFPGTVYNFGPDAFPTLRENSPQHPQSKKGALRVEMERRLEAASTDVQVIIVRAGDYFGPNAANNWFSGALVKPGEKVGTIRNPAHRGVGHQWAYLPDVAETMVRLVERAASLPAFAVYHMDGFFDEDGTEMATAIARVAGHGAKVKSFPWWIVPLAAPFVTFMREVKEMRYLWRESLRMSNERLVAILGEEPHTGLDEAVRTTLDSLGCLA